MNHPIAFNNLKLKAFNLRKSISNNMRELQFFMTQENDHMIDKIDNILKAQRSQLKDLEAELKIMARYNDESDH